MSAEFSIPIRVYIEDTDAGGIVYYVNYLKYLERARTEFMRTQGYGKAAFVGEDLMFVVTDVQVAYRSPARLDDELQACAQLTQIGAATLTFAQRVLRGDEMLVEGQVKLAIVGKHDGRPKRIPPEMRARLAG